MAQYLMSVLTDTTELGHRGGDAAIDAFNEQLVAEGHWVFAGGLASPGTATVVDGRDGEAVFTDGPYLESKEHIAGFWIIEAPISTWRSGSPPWGRRPATGGSRSGRSWSRDRRRRGDRPGPPRGVGPGWSRPWPGASGTSDIAEEMAAEAFAAAVERWPADGVPASPGAWLTTTARSKAIDRIRREARRGEKHKEALMLSDAPEPLGAIDDDRLRLVFTCCHPALAMEARVALTLRMVGGLTVPEIARAFLVQEAAMGQRITRAKAKINGGEDPLSRAVP